jgi:hypothetical protein
VGGVSVGRQVEGEVAQLLPELLLLEGGLGCLEGQGQLEGAQVPGREVGLVEGV